MNSPFEDNGSRSVFSAPAAEFRKEGRAVVVLRTLAVLLPAPLLLAAVGWLVLCCADFLPEGRDSFPLEWFFFALHTAAGTVLPPLLLAAAVPLEERDGLPVGTLRRFTGACHAVLLSFGAFVPLFYGSVFLTLFLLPDFNVFYTPFLLYRAGPLFCCLQLYTSWKIAVFLLPPAVRKTEPSRGALLFFCLAWFIALLTLFSAADAVYMDITGIEGGLADRSLIFFMLVALAWVLVRDGIRCLRWIFAALCLFGPLGGLLWLDMQVPPLDMAFALLRAALAVTAAVQLFLPSARRWLVQP